MGIAWGFATACIVVFTAIGLVTDWRTRRIPNALTVPAFCAALLFHAVAGFCQRGFPGLGGALWFSLAGFATGFGLIWIMWILGGGAGGGDVKFMAALGAWLGTWLTIQGLVLSAILSGLMTGMLLTKSVFSLKRVGVKHRNEDSQNSRKKKGVSQQRPWRSRDAWFVPFAVTAAVATWVILALEWTGRGLPWPPT